jgi:hypothetical protein
VEGSSLPAAPLNREASIRHLEEQHAVATRAVDRAKNVQVRREVHATVGRTRRAIEIDDARVAWIARVERKFNRARQLFIGADRTERLPAGHGRPRGDVDASNLGVRQGRQQKNQRKKIRSHGARILSHRDMDRAPRRRLFTMAAVERGPQAYDCRR